MTSEETPGSRAPALATIANPHPRLSTEVRLAFPLARLCPVSAEPQPGSTIAIAYSAGALLLETKALRAYLEAYAHQEPPEVRDLEELAQVVAQHCAQALGVEVEVHTHYVLTHGTMDVRVRCAP
jgi:NADPH-dependent 7-cyano-7-deazaguanine reductase QueF